MFDDRNPMTHSTVLPVKRPSSALMGRRPQRQPGAGQPVVKTAELSRRFRTRPRAGCTPVFSKTDEPVAWQTCCHDKPASEVDDIEVDSSLVGCGRNRDVLFGDTDRLGQQAGPWQRDVSPG
jgi:hypothetical protein